MEMKAILVIDMPTNCAKCKLAHLQGIGESICNAVDWSRRPSWCPLKPLPEVRDTHCHYDDWELERIKNAESRGFNWCIDEIMGETE